MSNNKSNLKKAAFLALGIIGLTWLPGNTNAQDHLKDDINADAWVVMEASTGDVILGENMDKKHFPASITKIVTSILALEERDWNETVSVSEHAQNTEGSSLDLQVGDNISLKDLLYGIMLHSGNDGAVAIAEHLSKNEEAFSQKMTAFAKSVGAENTQFKNASGLPDNDHYTTALDMALITKYAMKNERFRDMVQHKSYRWDARLWTSELMEHEKAEAKNAGIPWDGKPQVINHNRFLGLYEGATGIKNGFTHEARYTLVGSAKKNGYELIAVVLKSPNAETAYSDMEKLLDEGFEMKNTTMEKSSLNAPEKASSPESQDSTILNSAANRKEATNSFPYIPNYLAVIAIILIPSVILFLRRRS